MANETTTPATETRHDTLRHCGGLRTTYESPNAGRYTLCDHHDTEEIRYLLMGTASPGVYFARHRQNGCDGALAARLTAVRNTDGWCVQDSDGGVWWPDEDTQEEIERYRGDSAERAVEICVKEPMRGAWQD